MNKIPTKGFKYPETKKIAAQLGCYMFEQEFGEFADLTANEQEIVNKALIILSNLARIKKE